MNQSNNKHARTLARSAKGRWTSACLSAVLVLAAACGDDDSDDGSPANPRPTADAGSADASTGAPDAAVPAPADAGPTRPDAAIVTPDASVGDAGGGGDAGPVGGGNAAAIMRGKALADENVCTSCHRNTYEGAAFYPNITPDNATGIGTWTDDEIKDAISMGVGKGNDELCSLMMKYDFTDAELSDLVAFLRSLAPVSKNITAACTAN